MTTQTWLANTTAKSEAAAGTAVTLRAAQSGSSKKLTVNSGLISFLQNSSALTMSGYSLTGSQATSLLDMTGTWNTSGAPTALKLNVTDTNSNASSALLDLQVGGVSQFKVSKAGAVTAVGVAIPTISSSDTLSNKTLSSPTLSGTVAGNASWSGTQTFSTSPVLDNATAIGVLFRKSAANKWTAGMAAGTGTGDNFEFYNYTLGGNALVINSSTNAAAFASTVTVPNNVSFRITGTGADVRNAVKMTAADVIEFGTVNNTTTWNGFTHAFVTPAGTGLYIDNANVVTIGGAVVPTVSSTSTLTNKTLSSPTLSGTVGGSPTFANQLTSSIGTRVDSTTPYMDLYETDVSADNKWWRFVAAGGQLAFGILTDAAAQTNWLTVSRSGGTVTAINFAGSALTYGGVAIPTISSSDTLSNKTLSSPTLSGTVAGSPALTGQWQWSGGNDAAYWHAIVLAPTDAGNNKPSLYITHTSPSAYAIGLYDGTDTDGTIAFNCGVLNHNGAAITTTTNSQTLSNKTLSSPTVSGTIAGAATWSGTQTFSTVNVQNGTGVNSFKITDSTVGTTLAFTPVEPAGVRRVQFLFSPDGSAPASLGFFDETGIELASGKGFKVNSVAVPTISSSDTLSNKTLSGVTIADNTNIVLNTTNGTKIGTATSQKLGFFNATPVVQPTAVADATDAASVITQLNALLTRMRNLGLIAT